MQRLDRAPGGRDRLGPVEHGEAGPIAADLAVLQQVSSPRCSAKTRPCT